MSDGSLHYRTCHLCEAMCGLEIEHAKGQIKSIRGDKQDPFSKGHICPKAAALADLHQDPKRLRQPQRRTKDGWQTLSWEAAFDEVASQLSSLRLAYGANSIAIYNGNPNAHNYGMLTHIPAFIKQLGTRNRFSATSVDQLPHHLVSYLMYGHQLLLPVPDMDRTQLFVMLGANPIASNGSMMSVPGFKQRLKALQKRGGRLVVIDPRFSETAALADQHHFIRPGTDALLLASMLRTILEEGLVNPGRQIVFLEGLGDALSLMEPFVPSVVSVQTGIPEGEIRQLARTLAQTPKAVVYGRMGVSTQPFGGLCQWLINLLNIACGHLDTPGGAMFTQPAFDFIGGPHTRPGHFNVWQSRVRGLPEFSGELPVAALAEEILTPGERIRGLVTIAGNPVLSTPNGVLLEQALGQLDFMVAIDFYLNETTQLADIILPPASPLERDHYDMLFHALAVHNSAKYAEPLFPKPEGAYYEWEIFAELSARMAKQTGGSSARLPPPHKLLDGALQAGPYGKAAGSAHELDLAKLLASPHGIDLGPLRPCLPERLHTANHKIQCAPKELVADLERLETFLQHRPAPLMLIGRRSLRTNNSWMFRYPRLSKGPSACVLLMHPFDSHLRNLRDGQEVQVTSRVGSITMVLQVSETVMPGVVCMPHGYARSSLNAAQAAGNPVSASMNDLTDHLLIDQLSGNGVLNGITVEVDG